MLMLCGCSVVSASAQSMDSLFVHIPNEVLPMLVRNTRLDMLDLYNCGMKAEVENDFGGRACLLQKDSVHLLVQTSNVSRLELRVLPSDGDTLLGCVRTVETPAAYSQVQFFTRNWKPVRSPLSDEVAFSACWKPAEDFSDESLSRVVYTFIFLWLGACFAGSRRWGCGAGVFYILLKDLRSLRRGL